MKTVLHFYDVPEQEALCGTKVYDGEVDRPELFVAGLRLLNVLFDEQLDGGVSGEYVLCSDCVAKRGGVLRRSGFGLEASLLEDSGRHS